MGKITEHEELLVSAVDDERLMAHTRAIAQWERLSGSVDELKAFQYVQRELSELGYTTRLERPDALISLPKHACLSIGDLGDVECITHSMSASVDMLRGEIVYCGLGRREDYEQIDARGRIALVEGIAMPVKVAAGEEAGAIAQIHISGGHMHEMCISTVWGSPTRETAALLPRTPSVTIRSTDGERIKAMLQQRGSAQAEIIASVDTRYVPIPVLSADMPGTVEADQFVLFSGHIDSWYYGAMDNGSANATQLEAARILRQFGPYRRGLRLAFWSGHSHGRYAGSTWYADTHWEELHDRCVAHVNVDSLGGRGAVVLTHAYAMQELRPMARDVISALAHQEFHGTRVGRAGDHSFMGVGIPAMFMDLSEQPAPEVETPTSRAMGQLSGKKSGGLGWWWHTREDTVDKIDPRFLLRDAQIYVVILDRLLNTPILPMDFRLTVQEIQDLLNDYRTKAGPHFDLSQVIVRADQLRRETEALYQRVETSSQNPEAIVTVNRCFIRLARILTPLNYTQSGNFDHDAALGLGPIPLLAPIAELPQLEPGSVVYHRTLTGLVRRRNAVLMALREATEAVRITIAALDAAVKVTR